MEPVGALDIGGTAEERGLSSSRNWRAADRGEELLGEVEYPLFSDADVVGEWRDGPYELIHTIRMGPRSSILRRPVLVLRVRFHIAARVHNYNRTNDESYHGGSLEDEIAALASLRLGIRLKAGGEIREDGKPVAWSHKTDPVPPERPERPILPRLQSRQSPSEPSLENLAPLAKLPHLSVEDAVALVRAARLYQEAVWIAESVPELSWLMLTSAVETAAQRWRTSQGTPLERLRTRDAELVERLTESGG